MSGLRINIEKSRLYGIGIDPRKVKSFSNILNCKNDVLPFVYLGLSVVKDMSKVDNWHIVIDRFLSKLSSWKSKLLSVGGKVTLIKAMLGSLPLYNLSLFRAPIKVLHTLENIRRRFFWGFKDESKGNGRDVMFWNDVWLECGNGSWVGDWCWRSNPKGRSVDDLTELSNRLSTISLVDGSHDRWQWSLAPNGHFSVNHLSKLVDNNLLDQFALGHNHIWNNLVPIKLNVYIWRAVNNKLPTYCNLASKGINIVTSGCPLCNNVDETIDHILCECVVVKRLCLRYWDWWKVAAPHQLSIKDIIFGSFVPGGYKLLTKTNQAGLYVMMWSI
ncbi:reverse transcriptase domain, Reverse transcriptase zinc-binding domain protein [Artemisia annua]|uniref:Reverse transcriptase domain, Reverse transcriptase zinc-binding domain protein n=1 Tax=Artemisia annua TaxID=35608 RepID=A0A2U1MWD8_ARTAN|nr:reverse transcriptase domain, Reverse transcriptase zinc-binding domain protein [Artemisia annua]